MKSMLTNEWSKTGQILRASVCEQNKQYACLDDLILALAYISGTEKSRPAIEQSGYSVKKCRYLLLALTKLANLDLNKEYLPVRPDDTLKKIIQKDLKPFIEGKEDAYHALKKVVPSPLSTRDWLQKMSMYFVLLWKTGYNYYGIEKKGFSRFVASENNSFITSFKETQKELLQFEDAFDNSLWHASPLGKIQRQYGEHAARLMAVTFLAEADMVAGGFVRTSELAWTYCPDGLLNWHRHLSYVSQEVEKLVEAGYLESNGEGVRIQSKLIVTKEFHDGFLRFIRDSDSLGQVVFESSL